ncbi:MAG TPA: tyrosinase family protein [Acidobacteriaceae bacterium]|nr:tyrosinase family protein [Acidobacteriaceae bacterium]
MTRRQFGAAALGAAFLGSKPGIADDCQYPSYRPNAGLTYLPAPLKKTRAVLPKLDKIERPLLRSLKPGEVTKLWEAYRQLVSRPDNTGLLSQAKLHAYMCAGGNDVHATWAFLAWHRGFLYFHERILAKILGPRFRLPIWDWENSSDVPAPWSSNVVPELLDRTTCHRSSKLTFPVTDCRLQAWLFSDSFQNFAGGPTYPGNAYSGIHNDIHAQLGGGMVVPATAAADPIFYAHHANVDRYWWYWTKKLNLKPDPGFWKQGFSFYDDTGTAVWVCSDQLMDPECLGYSYAAHEPTVPLEGLGITLLNELNSSASRWNAVRSSITWLSDADRNQVLSAAREVYSQLSLKANDLLPQLNLLQTPATLELAELLARKAIPFPVRIKATLDPGGFLAGKYYEIALRKAPDGVPLPIAGFGTFSDPHMHSMEIMATGCFTPDALTLMLTAGNNLELWYGPADAAGRLGLDAKKLPKFELEFLNMEAQIQDLPALPL